MLKLAGVGVEAGLGVMLLAFKAIAVAVVSFLAGFNAMLNIMEAVSGKSYDAAGAMKDSFLDAMQSLEHAFVQFAAFVGGLFAELIDFITFGLFNASEKVAVHT